MHIQETRFDLGATSNQRHPFVLVATYIPTTTTTNLNPTMYAGYNDSNSPTGTPSRSSSTGTQSSSGSWNGLRASTTSSAGDVPSTVHNLLASTKSLQEILKDWSVGRADDGQVSDVYVQIGTDFNAIITAFAYHQIDLSDIHSVPQEMRGVLEQCLAEEPSPEVLAQFLPQLKAILIKLLRGLQMRQDTWQARAAMAGDGSPRNSR